MADAGYPTTATCIPPAGFGARHLLRVGAYAVALRRALDEVEYGANEANALISDIVFASIMSARTALYRLGRLRHRDPLDGAMWSSRVAQHLYYTKPDWEMDDVPVVNGFGMDVSRCVIAEFFESLDMADLCQRAICDQDIRSATHHGLVLERSGTLAGGAERCDFRYSVSDSDQPRQPSDDVL
ncbi:MAG: L-2-amino-thiazoline-4-carboxylic acid hydrolase [Acidimicrobiia bacterium]|nr:L-2-amino-thiazoline-4-carboxylic acid hydrolase [Acidimicrobiia bacterium]MDH5521317.1 L-2-amino-thiazoline-4-carboxylic acid hydrolase [Acidimicrobiia bacterium]